MARVEELEEHDLCGNSALCLYTLLLKKALGLVKGFPHEWDINVSHMGDTAPSKI